MHQTTAYDVLRYKINPLDSMFRPKSVAVIGASEREGSVGRTIVWNLISSSFGGVVYPVNPKRRIILGIKAYPSILDIPDNVDLAVIVTPAETVPAIIHDCVAAGVKGAIVISSGFKETGPEGAALEEQILAEARQGGMRILGPNCLGIMSPITGINATFASSMARQGNVAFISQSGALGTAILDWSFRENVGFSAFVSIGSMLDVAWGDLISYLGDDPNTQCIVIYMETIGDARLFLSTAREVALTKPIIVLKTGRTDQAARAAASHTGSITGNDEVLEAAFQRCGVLRVDHIADLFYMVQVLANQSRPKGPKLTIVTNAGGPGVLATDALVANGGQLAELSDETIARFDDMLPAPWSHNNPIDILGDAGVERYAKSIEIAAEDEDSDGILVILTPQAMTAPTETAQALREIYTKPDSPLLGKPVLASWMGGDDVSGGAEILNRANIPTFSYPDTAARMFTHMYRYQQRLRSLYETPSLPTGIDEDALKRFFGNELITTIRAADRTILTEYESMQLLAAYAIPTVGTYRAQNVEEAVEAAETIGYPVVVKLNSETITRKSEVGGVRLDLANEDEVRNAYLHMEATVGEKVGAEHFLGVTVQPMVDSENGYELIIGSFPDPQFGPTLLFGAGGTLVEVFKDRRLALPPLNTTLARRMMERTKIYKALKGVRGREPVDLGALEELLVRFSFLVVEQPWIKEINVNPLFVSSKQLLALDATIVLYDKDVKEESLPRLAIKPYPTQYVQQFEDEDGRSYTVRPIRPEDEPKVVKFHEHLSEQSVYLRYFRSLKLSQRVEHDRLTRICHVDYDRTVALVIEDKNENTCDLEIIAIGQLTRLTNPEEAEFAITVCDDYHKRGLGEKLLEFLLQFGRDEGIRHVIAYMLDTNRGMIHISRKLGFTLERDDDLVKASIDLDLVEEV